MISSKTTNTLAVLAITMCLTACATPGQKPNTWRSETMISKDTVKVDKIESTLKEILKEHVGTSSTEPFSTVRAPKKFTASTTKVITPQYEDYIRTRDNVQSYLQAVSEKKCGTFKTNALSSQAKTNFTLSSAATILGGVGGLLSPESTAQALSVTAGTLTGVQSHLSQNYYREKTFEIITQAIDVRRKSILTEVSARRALDRQSAIYSYTLNEAISDMIMYNNACSVVAGFEEISSSVDDKEKQIEIAAASQKAATAQSESGTQPVTPAVDTSTLLNQQPKRAINLSILSAEEILAIQ